MKGEVFKPSSGEAIVKNTQQAALLPTHSETTFFVDNPFILVPLGTENTFSTNHPKWKQHRVRNSLGVVDNQGEPYQNQMRLAQLTRADAVTCSTLLAQGQSAGL